MNTIQYDKEDVLALITKGVVAGVWDWDIETGKAWWSSSYYELLGYEPGEVEPSFGSFVDGLVYPDDRESIQQAINAHIEYNTPYILEIRLKTKGGEYKWFETSGSARRNINGKAIHMSGVIIDRHSKITLRKELERSEYLLNESGKIAKIAAWEFTPGCDVTYMSDSGYEIYGFEKGNTPAVKISQDMFTEKEWKEIVKRLEECFYQGKSYEMEHSLILPDGTVKWVYARAEPVLDSEGKAICVRGVTQDITERKQKEEELHKSYAIIEEQNKRLLNFAHIVTHNLRAHSGNLIKVTEILEEADTEEERLEMTGFVKRLGHTLYETINNLNQIVQIQTAKSLKKELLDFDKVYSKILTVLQQDIKESRATIVCDFSNCKTIESVPSYLESILLNFTTNAIKYRHFDRAPYIHVFTETKDGRTTVTIQDNGRGIDLEKYGPRLFGMYNTFHGNPDARGVGLFITKNQVEALGGEIKVSSEPNVGSTFKIIF